MSYRNKTYVAFASENIRCYRLMEAWRENERIEFSFYDAHDLYVSRDDSKPETIKRNLRERLKNAKQIVLLGSPDCKRKGGDGRSFLAHEVEIVREFKLPVIVANIDGKRVVDRNFIPSPLVNQYSISVSFQPRIIMHALDNFPRWFASKKSDTPHQLESSVYSKLGL